jgi:hypothetical protein
MLGTDPRPEMIDYVLTIGVKNNQTMSTVHDNFHVLLKDKTSELVSWLFDVLGPMIRLEVNNREGTDQKTNERKVSLPHFEG